VRELDIALCRGDEPPCIDLLDEAHEDRGNVGEVPSARRIGFDAREN
jgi:hypothetical protein